MLINLSNHPLAYWAEQQRAMAEGHWGQVVDLPFPVIPPTLTTQEVVALAEEYCARCVDMLHQEDDPSSAVHLMGEMVFCFHLAAMLKHAGIEVVASTSERIVCYTDGTKNSEFNFVTFRAY